MGNFLSGFDMDRDGSPRFFEDSVYETRNRPFLTGEENYEDFSEYSNITATVFVIVMIILLLVLLICCVKTVLVCRRQKRVNDQRRRMMQRDNAVDQSALPTDPNILNQSFLRAYTFDHHHHRIETITQNGHVMFHHDYNDQPPAYDQVIGLPPSYDSIVILNGTVQSRATSVVGSVRNSVLDTVRSLRRGSRGSAVRLDIASGGNQSDGPATMITGTTSGPSEIGSTKSESLVTSVSNALVVHRQSMEPNHSDPLPTQVKRTKSLRKPKSEEDEESLTT